MMLDFGLSHLGTTPPQMTPSHLRELLFDIFPRKITTDAKNARDIIAELQAFWTVAQREFQLENATALLPILDAKAIRMLEKEMNNPHNYGMAKSFMMLGKQMGFDMTTEEGINEWMMTYSAKMTGIPIPRGISSPNAPSTPSRDEPNASASDEPNEDVKPLRYTFKRITGKGHEKHHKKK